MLADGMRMMLHVPTKTEWTDEMIQFMMDGRANEMPWFAIASRLGMTMNQCERKYSQLKQAPATRKGKWSRDEELQLVIDYQQAGGDMDRIPPRGRSRGAIRCKVRDLITSGKGDRLLQGIQLGTDG
jgi:hypothetical protein